MFQGESAVTLDDKGRVGLRYVSVGSPVVDGGVPVLTPIQI